MYPERVYARMPGGAPSSSMPCRTGYGIGPKTSIAGPSSRSGCSCACPSSGSPHQQPAIATTFCPTSSGGTNGAGGAVITVPIVVNASGSSAAHPR